MLSTYIANISAKNKLFNPPNITKIMNIFEYVLFFKARKQLIKNNTDIILCILGNKFVEKAVNNSSKILGILHETYSKKKKLVQALIIINIGSKKVPSTLEKDLKSSPKK